jgi:hypothetical protein
VARLQAALYAGGPARAVEPVFTVEGPTAGNSSDVCIRLTPFLKVLSLFKPIKTNETPNQRDGHNAPLRRVAVRAAGNKDVVILKTFGDVPECFACAVHDRTALQLSTINRK